jgi:predicted AlkP superfamily phosphohydrolase/phosphomutase
LLKAKRESGRLIIIGLDGVPFGMVEHFAGSGVMPHTAGLISNGAFRQMRSAVPEISSVAWSSIITGKNPGEHGIFGFTDLAPFSYRLTFPNFTNLQAPPFWQLSSGKSVIINVPSTYPVSEMKGVHISGFVSIDINKSVHPASVIPELNGLDYRLDVDSQKAHEDLGLFLTDLDQTLTARIKAADYLWDYTDWRTFMLAFTGTDRLMHFLYEAYEEQSHRYRADFVNHFRRIDEAIGSILGRLGQEDELMMLSDHGFERLKKEVYINNLLASEGFLSFKAGGERELGNVASASRAFALDPARIYIHRKGRYPDGSVSQDDADSCLRDLEDLFSSLRLEGRKVIRHIYRRRDAYCGPFVEQGPDLVLIAEPGFNLKGSMRSAELTGEGPFTGKHTYEDAFVLLKDKDMGSELGEQPSVVDAGQLIRSLATDSQA